MSDDPSAFHELLRSPFGDSPVHKEGRPSTSPWLLVAGIAIGAIAVLFGYLLASSPEQATAASTTAAGSTVPPTTGPTTTVVETVAFPPGFVAVTDMLAAKPEYVVDLGDELVLGFTTATRRGFEQTSGFDGGDWVLETASGDEIASISTSFDYGVPGNFSVRFPAVGDSTPTRVKLVALWRADVRDEVVAVPWGGAPPFETGGVDVDLGGGISASLDRITLDEGGGEVAWSLQGTGDPGGVVQVFISEGGTSNPATIYYDSGGGFNPFGGPPLGDAALEGVEMLTRQETGVDGGESDVLSVDVNVTLVASTQANAEFDLAGIPGLEH